VPDSLAYLNPCLRGLEMAKKAATVKKGAKKTAKKAAPKKKKK
jgi:hypothetical protein